MQKNFRAQGQGQQLARPTLKGLKPPTEKTGGLPCGDFIVEIEVIKEIFPRAGGMAVVPEFFVRKIYEMTPYVNPAGISNEVKLGDRRSCWFEFGGEWGYGEADWAAFLKATGSTDESIDADYEIAMSAANPYKGQFLRIRRVRQLKKNGLDAFTKTIFEPAPADWDKSAA